MDSFERRFIQFEVFNSQLFTMDQTNSNLPMLNKFKWLYYSSSIFFLLLWRQNWSDMSNGTVFPIRYRCWCFKLSKCSFRISKPLFAFFHSLVDFSSYIQSFCKCWQLFSIILSYFMISWRFINRTFEWHHFTQLVIEVSMPLFI